MTRRLSGLPRWFGRGGLAAVAAVAILTAAGVTASGQSAPPSGAPAVSPAPPSGGPAATPSSSGSAQTAASYHCLDYPANGFKLNPTLPPPVIPKKAKRYPHKTTNPVCAQATAFSNVRKLHEAALIGPGFSSISSNIHYYLIAPNHKCKNHGGCPRSENYSQAVSAGELEYHGRHQFPPATATLLAFGFVPVTATLQLTEIGALNIYAVGPNLPGECPPNSVACLTTDTTLYSRVSLRVSDVRINGVPFDVGPACRTVSPFVIKLTGSTPTYSIFDGGELVGAATIPPFTGCGVGENVDSLFSASVSGAGNGLLLTQGETCFPDSDTSCPPCKPIPHRAVNLKPVCQPTTASDRH